MLWLLRGPRRTRYFLVASLTPAVITVGQETLHDFLLLELVAVKEELLVAPKMNFHQNAVRYSSEETYFLQVI